MRVATGQWVEARDVAKYPTSHGTAFTAKIYPLHVPRVKNEKPCLGEINKIDQAFNCYMIFRDGELTCFYYMILNLSRGISTHRGLLLIELSMKSFMNH